MLLAVPLLLLAACGSGRDSAVPAQPDQLVVVQDTGPGTTAVRHALRCDPPGGDHPRAAAACQHLAGVSDPFAALPRDRSCTEVYGGPDRATVTGTWRGRAVDVQLTRVDGCRIAQWEQLGPLLDRAVGAGAPGS